MREHPQHGDLGRKRLRGMGKGKKRVKGGWGKVRVGLREMGKGRVKGDGGREGLRGWGKGREGLS